MMATKFVECELGLYYVKENSPEGYVWVRRDKKWAKVSPQRALDVGLDGSSLTKGQAKKMFPNADVDSPPELN